MVESVSASSEDDGYFPGGGGTFSASSSNSSKKIETRKFSHDSNFHFLLSILPYLLPSLSSLPRRRPTHFPPFFLTDY